MKYIIEIYLAKKIYSEKEIEILDRQQVQVHKYVGKVSSKKISELPAHVLDSVLNDTWYLTL